MTTNEPNTKGGPTEREPADVVTDFLLALARSDLDTALGLVTDDLEYINVTLPTVHGRDRLERLFRPALRGGKAGFDVRIHHIATEDNVVLTERTDELHSGKFAMRFWVYGRFVVRDGRIAVWRDSFDWLDITVSAVRGWLGVLDPRLNRPMPSA